MGEQSAIRSLEEEGVGRGEFVLNFFYPFHMMCSNLYSTFESVQVSPQGYYIKTMFILTHDLYASPCLSLTDKMRDDREKHHSTQT